MTNTHVFLQERIDAKTNDAAPPKPMPVVVSWIDPMLVEEDRTGFVSMRGDLTDALFVHRINTVMLANWRSGVGTSVTPERLQ